MTVPFGVAPRPAVIDCPSVGNGCLEVIGFRGAEFFSESFDSASAEE